MIGTYETLDELQRAYERATTAPDLGGAGDTTGGGGGLSADVSARDATDTVTDALRDEGISPPPDSDLDLEDYVKTDVKRGSRGETTIGTREATIRVGPNGNILPSPSSLPDLDPCTQRRLQKATDWLDFEFFELPGGDYDVQVQHVDVATSEITEADYAGWN
jgi:hypothetical protein